MENAFEKMVEEFEPKFKELVAKKNKALDVFVIEYREFYKRMSPIIDCMKSNGIYFLHPEYEGIKTRHGPIIARSSKFGSDIYIVDDDRVLRVNTSDDTIDEHFMQSLNGFLRICNLEHACRGLGSLRNSLPKALESVDKHAGDIEMITRELVRDRQGKD